MPENLSADDESAQNRPFFAKKIKATNQKTIFNAKQINISSLCMSFSFVLFLFYAVCWVVIFGVWVVVRFLYSSPQFLWCDFAITYVFFYLYLFICTFYLVFSILSSGNIKNTVKRLFNMCLCRKNVVNCQMKMVFREYNPRYKWWYFKWENFYTMFTNLRASAIYVWSVWSVW